MTLNLCSSSSKFLSEPILIINSTSLSLIFSLMLKSGSILLSTVLSMSSVDFGSFCVVVFPQIIHVT